MKAKFDSLTGQNDHDGRRGKAEAALRNLVRERFPARLHEDAEYRWEKVISAHARTICRKPFSACNADDIERMMEVLK
jgi:hypothetical protein